MEERLKRHYTSRYKGRFYDLAIKMYFEEGIPIKRISKELSVSRMSIYRWICILAEENGIDSMRKKVSLCHLASFRDTMDIVTCHISRVGVSGNMVSNYKE